MKAPDIVEAWMWRDPEEIIERLLGVSAAGERRALIALSEKPLRAERDRYYTQARRLHVKRKTKEAMKGKRC